MKVLEKLTYGQGTAIALMRWGNRQVGGCFLNFSRECLRLWFLI